MLQKLEIKKEKKPIQSLLSTGGKGGRTRKEQEGEGRDMHIRSDMMLFDRLDRGGEVEERGNQAYQKNKIKEWSGVK